MKLIKLSSDHYIIVDDSEIKEGDWIYNAEREPSILKCVGKGSLRGWQKITHFTEPLERYVNIRTQEDRDNGLLPSVLMVKQDAFTLLSLSEVKELLGEVDVEKKAYDTAFKFIGTNFEQVEYLKSLILEFYNQAFEDNKDRKYTEEDMRKMFDIGEGLSSFNDGDDNKFRHALSLVQPHTSWDVEFVNSKLKLK